MAEYEIGVKLNLEYLYALKVEAESEEDAQEIALSSDLGISQSLAGQLGPSQLLSENRELSDG